MTRYGSPEAEVAHYNCRRTAHAAGADGLLEAAAWDRAERSPRFVDMVDGGPAIYATQAAALWDDANLYVRFWIEEPFVTAAVAERDELVFLENDVEVFIDGGDSYYEFEVNALGTIYEVFYIWADACGKRAELAGPEFDRLAQNALSFGGDYDRTGADFWKGRHPRGIRWAFRRWDLPGLRAAVQVDGKINDATVVDKGWTVDLAFPWKGMAPLANGRSLPPRAGDVWRIFFGRFEKLMAGGAEIAPHPGWVWSKHGVYDTHLPEVWPFVHFSDEVAG
jgi:hypothetical protein